MSSTKRTATFAHLYSGCKAERVTFSADAELQGQIWPDACGTYHYSLYIVNDNTRKQTITDGECPRRKPYSARSIAMCEVTRIGHHLIDNDYRDILTQREAAQAILDGRTA